MQEEKGKDNIHAAGGDVGEPTQPGPGGAPPLGPPRMPVAPVPPTVSNPRGAWRRKAFGIAAAVVIALLIASNIGLWSMLTSTRDDLDRAEERSELATDGLAEISDRVDTIEFSLGDFGSGAEDISGRVDDLESNLEDLQSCVNDYLEAVDASGGGSYSFSFC